ncbi:hypothetical protein P389DRAFT_164661 [Cystobasidium minutum MCA 4210]|uniref:uncharacterized protein n=1 Tax=Cystobasidium minutum MCA 4210 TaxID=1397322 RepID=UPI0034CE01F0|eukprot:jgi/Rhomi1/164661/fgenesh1_kg.1_\
MRQKSTKACFCILAGRTTWCEQYRQERDSPAHAHLTMATRTVTKTKTRAKTKSKTARWDAEFDLSDEAESKGETSAAGHRRLDALRNGSRQSQSSSAANSSFDLSNSSDEDAEDDFADDVRAEIRQDLALREEKKKNGGRAPRKKTKESKADKQTQHTRKLLQKGQPREQKTAKWAVRERQVNPLVKLLNIEFTIEVSDSNSSSASEGGDESETTKAYRASSKRVRKRNFNRQYGLEGTATNGQDRPAKAESDEEVVPNVDRKGKGTSRTMTKPASIQVDTSATEDSEEELPVRVKKEEDKDLDLCTAKQDVKPDLSKHIDSESEGETSEDISPLGDPAGYTAQIARRAARARGDHIPQGRITTLPPVKREPSSPRMPVKQEPVSPRPRVKLEPLSPRTRVKQEPVSPPLRVKKESKDEEMDPPTSTTPDLTRIDSSEDENSDGMPDYPVSDPRYLEWMRRQASRRASGKGQVTRPVGFRPYQQRDAKPNFDVKSEQQAKCGPLVLGFSADGHSVEIPAAINRFLRGYQRQGVKFFWEHYQKREGGLLGDDMGLGKTIQVISFLAAIMGHRCTEAEEGRRLELLNDIGNARRIEKATDLGPTALVIAPASVVENWARELATWTYLSVAIYKPASERTHQVLKAFKRGRLDVVICGIDSARNHIEDLMDLDFSCIFVDEVHKVKNPSSRTSKALQLFACKVRFGLTGTAMQNRYSELHTVLDWCFPGRLGDRNQWRDYVESPLKEAQRKDATQQQLAIGRARAFALVHYLLPHFFLRRTKDLIADQLPKKTDKIVFCPLTEDQKTAYKRLLAHEEVQIILTHDEPCPCGATDEHGLPYARGNCHNRDWAQLVLKWITIFTKVANHAVLIYPDKKDKIQQPEKYAQDQELIRWAYQDTYRDRGGDLTLNNAAETDKRLCGKWPILRDLLESWHAKGDKVLLFSRSTRLLDALEWWIEASNYNVVRLDGSTPADHRLTLCDQFNDPAGGQFLFLISTLAGGVGLNLTSANRVVIFDPNWNPVSDLQAMDRSYRWGQTRDVTVYRLVGAGSIEELIYTRQIYKQHQAEIAYSAANPSRMFLGVQDDKRNQGELFGVKNLFRFTDTTNRTKRSIEQAHISELGFELMNFASKAARKRKRGGEEADDSEGEGDDKPEDQAILDVLIGEKKVEDLRDDDDDDIARILRDNGVTYTHDHSELVKSSKIESKITKAALKVSRNCQILVGSADIVHGCVSYRTSRTLPREGRRRTRERPAPSGR